MIKTNIKMRVTPEQSVKVQEICFNRGFEWVSGENKAIYINEPFITISSEKFFYFSTIYSILSFIKIQIRNRSI